MSLPRRGDAGGLDSVAVLLSADYRALRRELRPTVWVTLEEVALDAAAEDGRLVARTSARRVAERLGLDPGTAAGALRDLRRRGLLVLEREKGQTGRFGLSVYQLGPVAGLSVIQPCTAEPCTAQPSVVRPVMEEPAMVSPCVGTPHMASPSMEQPDADRANLMAPGKAGPAMVRSAVAADPDAPDVTRCASPHGRSGRSTASDAKPTVSLQSPGQEALGLGRASS
jgi:hypothetical protein